MAANRTRKKTAAKKAAAKTTTTRRAAAKTADVKAAARAKLSVPKPCVQSRFEKWLKDPENVAAKAFVEAWLDMAPKGETDFTGADVRRDLVTDYGLPFSDPTGFGRRMHEIYGDKWLAAKGANHR